MNNDFWSLVGWFANDFHSWWSHSWKSLANHLTRDQKSLFTVTHALFFISQYMHDTYPKCVKELNGIKTPDPIWWYDVDDNCA